MKLIRELNEETSIVISEEAGTGKKRLHIEGVFLQANKKNKNGRIYPSHVMEREVDRYIKEKVETNRAYGELGHPNGPQINMHLVSHVIKELRKDGDNYIGKAVIAEGTTNGQIVCGLLDVGANLGVSSRGLGSLKQRNGIMEVQEDFHLATAADIVGDPSAPDAFVRGLMEDVEWICENGVWAPHQVDAAQSHVNAAVRSRSQSERDATALGLFEHFMKSVRAKN